MSSNIEKQTSEVDQQRLVLLDRIMTPDEETQWEDYYCKPRRVTFWGNESMVSPVLIPWFFGDGQQPIALEPMATRPEYYVIAGHSGWDLENFGEDPFCEHLEDVYMVIEERFGNSDDEKYDDETEAEWEARTNWPALNTGCGMGWGGYRNPMQNAHVIHPVTPEKSES